MPLVSARDACEIQLKLEYAPILHTIHSSKQYLFIYKSKPSLGLATSFQVKSASWACFHLRTYLNTGARTPRPPLGPSEGPCGTLHRTPPEHKNFLAVNSTAVAPRGKATEHRGRRWLLFQWCPADEVRSTAVLHPKGRGRFRGAGIWGLYENSPFLRHPREQIQKRGRGVGKDDILSAWQILRFPT